MEFTLDNGCCNPGKDGFNGNSRQQLPVVDWLADIPEAQLATDLVEVQFKNTRKGYYLNSNKLKLKKGDLVTVEASPGHDIGRVSLTGALVLHQIKKNNISLERYETRRIYRIARQMDLDKWEESKAKEQDTMIQSRQIAKNLNLEMKIGDVEYQADGTKAIFYYIADGRVDFRELIKVLAATFHVRIEMKQIGARQEAGRIGGFGPCGRELCCATFMSNFVSVSTNTARIQDIAANPLKMAGQCAKIKCCMNYEVPTYLDAKKDFPRTDIPLETVDATYYHFKTDVFNRLFTYSTDKHLAANLVTISVDRAKEVIAANRRGEKVESLEDKTVVAPVEPVVDYQNVVGQDSLTRFDRTRRNRGNQNRGNFNNRNNNRARYRGNNQNRGNGGGQQNPSAE